MNCLATDCTFKCSEKSNLFCKYHYSITIERLESECEEYDDMVTLITTMEKKLKLNPEATPWYPYTLVEQMV
jgi:hypothetical protein